MAKEGKILNIGFLNSIINQEWAIFPWTGAVFEAKKNRVNLMTFCGNVIKSREGFYNQGNIIYDIAKKQALTV